MLEYRLDHRQYRVGLGFDQFAGDAVAFGHPGPFIEQAGGFEEGGEVDLDGLAAEGLESFDGGGEQRRALGAAEEFQLFGHAETKARTH